MRLRKEVLNRLLLAKSALLPAVGGELNAYTVARQVLSAHDAADLVFAAIAEQKGVLPAKDRAPSMMECLRLIGGSATGHEPYFRRLNIARDNLKHVGNLPSTQQWGNVVPDVTEKLSDICEAMLDTSFQDVDEVDLLMSDEVREHLSEAKLRRASGELKLALEEVGRALSAALEGSPSLSQVRVGRPNAEDALRLTAYGIPAGDFLRLQEFLPEVTKFLSNPVLISWRQNRFGHPGNWSDVVVDFCVSTCLRVALNMQGAPAIPKAVEFQYRYGYRITAREDRVELWEDLVEGIRMFGRSQPFRTHVRYMSRGESIAVPFMDELVSYDWLPTGEQIRRVRVSDPSFVSLGAIGGERQKAQFVDFAQVDVTCIPHQGELLGQRLPELPEVPWEPDPSTDNWVPLDVVPKAEPSLESLSDEAASDPMPSESAS